MIVPKLLLLFAVWIPLACSKLPEDPIQNVITTEPPPTPTPVPPKLPLQGDCFYAEPDLCIQRNASSPASCECFPHPTIEYALYCCNVTDFDKAFGCVGSPIEEWKYIHIRNLTLEELDVSKSTWKFFSSFAVTDSPNLKYIPKEFTRFSRPKCVNLSSNSLLDINQRAFTNLLQNLQILDLSFNNLSYIPNTMKNSNLTLNIKGNAILCKNLTDVLNEGYIKWVEPEKTFCMKNQSFHWFNSTDPTSLKLLIRMNQLQNECPVIQDQHCSCTSERFNYEILESGLESMYFTAKVDCSGLGLVELPPVLPSDTVTLDVSNNSITSLAALTDNPSYKGLTKLNADSNLISSMYDLEGSEFIKRFATLSLKHNLLRFIPIYILTNTLDRNPRGAVVELEGNPIHCDCNTAKMLKVWLLSRSAHVKDYTSIYCKNTGGRVIDLAESKFCHSQHDWADYIYLLIAFELLLLTALILKVSYDYYVFKTSGYLPWPASKMPKMPWCDWLCET